MEQDWNVNNRSQVVLEVDTRQSNFPLRDYKTVKETLRNDEESKYVDYLLLDSAGAGFYRTEAAENLLPVTCRRCPSFSGI